MERLLHPGISIAFGLHLQVGTPHKDFVELCPMVVKLKMFIPFRFTGTDGPSGFGFELTFRLKRETGESAPPTWPAELMQGLARYVFQSGNRPGVCVLVL